MEEMNLKELERIPIPEGLEQRLSQRIDEWAAAERRRRNRRIISVAAAACAALVVGLAVLLKPEATVNIDGKEIAKVKETKTENVAEVKDNKTENISDAKETESARNVLFAEQKTTPRKKNNAKETSRKESINVEDFTEISPEEAEEIDRRMRLLQAKIDNKLAEQTAELILAEYYAQQIANGEVVGLPEVETMLGETYIPLSSIMSLVME